MPKISVIMSVYNDERYVSKSIESILNQTYKDFEFIITDDCSKDGSLQILRQFAINDSRIVLVENKENLKLTKNLNNMLSLARGELIARMDSDDISFPDRFEKQVGIFASNPEVDFVFTGTILIDENGNEICESWRPDNVENILKMMVYKSYIPHPTIMAKRELFSRAGNYTELKGYGQEDRELWEKFLTIGVRFFYLKEPELYYRINSKGITYKKINSECKYIHKIIYLCIDNFHKRKALKLFISNLSLLSFREKLDITIKLILPVRLRMWKVDIISKYKRKIH
jgi:glycosyltransferase involved in cell wall biosynthesis